MNRHQRRAAGDGASASLERDATAAMAAGRLDEAAAAWTRLLRRAPGHAAAAHGLGRIALARGALDEAARRLGQAERRLGHSHAGVLFDLAQLAQARGDPATATATARRGLALAPAAAIGWSVVAAAATARGDLAAAAAASWRAVRTAPGAADLHTQRGVVLHQLGRRAEAAAHYRRALALEGADRQPEALANLGCVAQEDGHGAAAVALLRQALDRLPDPRLMVNLGQALRQIDDLAGADRWFRAAIVRAPALAAAHRGVAVVAETRDAAAAEAALDRALRLAPDDAEALAQLADRRRRAGDDQAAARLFAAARALAPGRAMVRVLEGLFALGQGRLADGWPGHGARFETGLARPWRRPPRPVWRGEPLAGRRLLVWREQGIGDEVMFSAGYPALAARADGPVVIEAEPRLAGLFARSLAAATVRPAPSYQTLVENPAGPPPDYDCHIAAGDLPAVVMPTLAAVPVGRCGWLVPDPAVVAAWRDRLAVGADRRLLVGLCWRSTLVTAGRRAAYSTLADWRPVLALPGVRLVSLQADAQLDELAALAHWPDVDLFSDLESLAGLIANLDLVLSVSTAVGELAAALGVPVWRPSLAGDWTRFGTGVRPWYPAQRVFGPPPAGIGALARAVRGLRPPTPPTRGCPLDPAR